MKSSKLSKATFMRAFLILSLFLSGVSALGALSLPAFAAGGNGSDGAPNPDDPSLVGDACMLRALYFDRNPRAGQCYNLDKVTNQQSAKGGKSAPPGPLAVVPTLVPPIPSDLPLKRDEIMNYYPLKCTGYPLSDTQCHLMLRDMVLMGQELQNDPERSMWQEKAKQGMQMTDAGNDAANLTTNQAASAISFQQQFLPNFTAQAGNRWLAIRDQLFIPIAVLLLLPGAVLCQVKAIVSQGSPILGETNPFEGIFRSIIAIFMIPGTFLVINYGIDVSNSIRFTIADEYTRMFGTDMYHDAQCAIWRAFPVNAPNSNLNHIPTKSKPQQDPMGGTGPWAPWEAQNIAQRLYDPCAGLDQSIVPDEQLDDNKQIARMMTNYMSGTLSMTWNIMCAFQEAFLLYLWCMGPIAAALWVWPIAQLQRALPSWVEGVITLCFWSLFWNTVVLLLACFRGVGMTGTVIISALTFLATICVKYAFDFVSLISQGASQGVSQALQQAAKGGGGGGGGGGGKGGAGQKGAAGGSHGGQQHGALNAHQRHGQQHQVGHGKNGQGPGGHGALLGHSGSGAPPSSKLGTKVPGAHAPTDHHGPGAHVGNSHTPPPPGLQKHTGLGVDSKGQLHALGHDGKLNKDGAGHGQDPHKLNQKPDAHDPKQTQQARHDMDQKMQQLAKEQQDQARKEQDAAKAMPHGTDAEKQAQAKAMAEADKHAHDAEKMGNMADPTKGGGLGGENGYRIGENGLITDSKGNALSMNVPSTEAGANALNHGGFSMGSTPPPGSSGSTELMSLGASHGSLGDAVHSGAISQQEKANLEKAAHGLGINDTSHLQLNTDGKGGATLTDSRDPNHSALANYNNGHWEAAGTGGAVTMDHNGNWTAAGTSVGMQHDNNTGVWSVQGHGLDSANPVTMNRDGTLTDHHGGQGPETAAHYQQHAGVEAIARGASDPNAQAYDFKQFAQNNPAFMQSLQQAGEHQFPGSHINTDAQGHAYAVDSSGVAHHIADYNQNTHTMDAVGTNGHASLGTDGNFHATNALDANGHMISGDTSLNYNSNLHAFTNSSGDVFNSQSNSFSHLSAEQSATMQHFAQGSAGQHISEYAGGNYHMEMNGGHIQAVGENGQAIASYNNSTHEMTMAGTAGHVSMDANGNMHAANGQSLEYNANMHAFTNQSGDQIYNAQSNSFTHLNPGDQQSMTTIAQGAVGHNLSEVGGNYHMEATNGHIQAIGENGQAIASYNNGTGQWDMAGTAGHVSMDNTGTFHSATGAMDASGHAIAGSSNLEYNSSMHAFTNQSGDVYNAQSNSFSHLSQEQQSTMQNFTQGQGGTHLSEIGGGNYHMEVNNGQIQAIGENGQSIAHYNSSSQQWDVAGTANHVSMDNNGAFHAANGQSLEYNSSMHAFTNQSGDQIYNAQSNSFTALSHEQQAGLQSFNSGPASQSLTEIGGGNYHMEVNNGHLQAIGENGQAIANYNSSSQNWDVAGTANHISMDNSGGFHSAVGATDVNGHVIASSSNLEYNASMHAFTNQNGDVYNAQSNSFSHLSQEQQTSLQNFNSGVGGQGMTEISGGNYHMEVNNGHLQAIGENGQAVANYNSSSHNWDVAGTANHVSMDNSGHFHSANGSSLEYNSNMHAYTNQGGDQIYNAQSNSFSSISQEPGLQNLGQGGIQNLSEVSGGNYHMEVNNGHLQAIGESGQAVANYNSSSQNWDIAGTNNNVSMDNTGSFHTANGTSLEYNSSMHAYTNQGGDQIYNAHSGNFSTLSHDQQISMTEVNQGAGGQYLSEISGGNYHMEVNSQGQLQAINDSGQAVGTYNSNQNWEIAGTNHNVYMDNSGSFHTANGQTLEYNAGAHAYTNASGDQIYNAHSGNFTTLSQDQQISMTEVNQGAGGQYLSEISGGSYHMEVNNQGQLQAINDSGQAVGTYNSNQNWEIAGTNHNVYMDNSGSFHTANGQTLEYNAGAHAYTNASGDQIYNAHSGNFTTLSQDQQAALQQASDPSYSQSLSSMSYAEGSSNYHIEAGANGQLQAYGDSGQSIASYSSGGGWTDTGASMQSINHLASSEGLSNTYLSPDGHHAMASDSQGHVYNVANYDGDTHHWVANTGTNSNDVVLQQDGNWYAANSSTQVDYNSSSNSWTAHGDANVAYNPTNHTFESHGASVSSEHMTPQMVQNFDQATAGAHEQHLQHLANEMGSHQVHYQEVNGTLQAYTDNGQAFASYNSSTDTWQTGYNNSIVESSTGWQTASGHVPVEYNQQGSPTFSSDVANYQAPTNIDNTNWSVTNDPGVQYNAVSDVFTAGGYSAPGQDVTPGVVHNYDISHNPETIVQNDPAQSQAMMQHLAELARQDNLQGPVQVQYDQQGQAQAMVNGQEIASFTGGQWVGHTEGGGHVVYDNAQQHWVNQEHHTENTTYSQPKPDHLYEAKNQVADVPTSKPAPVLPHHTAPVVNTTSAFLGGLAAARRAAAQASQKPGGPPTQPRIAKAEPAAKPKDDPGLKLSENALKQNRRSDRQLAKENAELLETMGMPGQNEEEEEDEELKKKREEENNTETT